jgi:hypothetical protein
MLRDLEPNRLGVANEWGSFIAQAKYRYPEDEGWWDCIDI